jgi:hypothetical protein
VKKLKLTILVNVPVTFIICYRYRYYSTKISKEVLKYEARTSIKEQWLLAWDILYKVLTAHEPNLQLSRHGCRSREAHQGPAYYFKL